MSYREIQLPLTPDVCKDLKVGDALLLTGDMYTLRDAGHMRLLEEFDAQDGLPYGLEGQIIFYAGPTPAKNGQPFGAIGPTTASRMDFAAPALYERGLLATIGKGDRSQAVKDACKKNGTLYLVATGGAAALLAQSVLRDEVLAYEELGTEALRRITVKDFPVFVGIDTTGADIYDL